MAVADAVVIAVVGLIVIEGIWLAALTYLMWRRRRQEKAKLEAPKDESTGST